MSFVRQKRMIEATNVLAKYYGLPDTQSVIKTLKLDAMDPQKDQNIGNLPTATELRIQNIMSDTTCGVLPSRRLIKKIVEEIGPQEAAKYLRIFFDGKSDTTITELEELGIVSINELLGYSVGQADNNTVMNANSSSPSKTFPSVCTIECNTSRVGLIQKNIHPTVIFLNGIPNVEINRAVPFINIEFYFARPPINETTKQVQTLSLTKFLEGAQTVDETSSSPLNILASAGKTAGKDIVTGEPISDIYATAGMELFTSPQTLVNANEEYDRILRSNPVLDKFRPLMTLKDLQITVQPSRGLMSYKSATLNLVLHDRSRLSEVAEFVRADLYGTNEIKIQYGWSHPDGETVIGVDNPYGDLINGMRVEEKYGVVNSSFSFDEVGQVNITLELAMRGGIEFRTELVSSDKDKTGNVLKKIGELQKLVGEHRKRLSGEKAGLKTKEIRGSQILDAASDATSHLKFSKKLINSMKTFESQLKGKYSPANAKELSDALEELFGDEKKKKEGKNGLVGKLRETIASSIGRKIEQMAAQPDPYLVSIEGLKEKSHRIRQRNIDPTTMRKEYAALKKNFPNLKNIPNGYSVSLARLLLSFVAEPLANTGKFDDIQLIFYPFNKYAGFASKINIANFNIDLTYFVQQFYRYRLDQVSKSGVMNLSEFLNFVNETIVNDPAAHSYGLRDKGGAWFKTPFEKGEPKETKIVLNAADYQSRLEERLKNVTPDASFQMPQLDFYIEALPEQTGDRDNEDSEIDTGRTILRVHIFDQVASSYDTLNALLAASRDSELNAIGGPPSNDEGGNKGVQDSKKAEMAQILSSAEKSQLLRPIGDSDPRLYEIVGGPEQVKQFLMDSMPYVIYGVAGTTVKSAQLSSMQNPALSTINLLRSFERQELEPNGENPGGLPMRIIPTELNMTTLGCPLISFAQQFFVDFQTGTTADNIYSVYGLTHTLRGGEFSTEIKLCPLDAWGKYESPIRKIFNAAEFLKEEHKKQETQ